MHRAVKTTTLIKLIGKFSRLKYRHRVEHDGVDSGALLQCHDADSDDERTLKFRTADDLRQRRAVARLRVAFLHLVKLVFDDGRATGTAKPHQRFQRIGPAADAEKPTRRLDDPKRKRKTEQHRSGGADDRQVAPAESQSEAVDRQNSDGDRQLDAGAQGAAKLARSRLGDVQRSGDADQTAADAGQKTTQTEELDLRADGDHRPADDERCRGGGQSPTPASPLDQAGAEHAPEHGAQRRDRTEPRRRVLVVVHDPFRRDHLRQCRGTVADRVAEGQRTHVPAKGTEDFITMAHHVVCQMT